MKPDRPYEGRFGEEGTTLLELLFAVAILIIVIAGILGLFSYCMAQNKTQGEVATRTTEYCEDKMEQLMALQFADTASNTTVYPTASSGGTGLGGLGVGSSYGGTDPTNPVASYVDYLDEKGNLLTTTAGAFYIRVWQIKNDATTGNVKTITVVTTLMNATGVSNSAGIVGVNPSTTLVSMKANF